MTIVDTLHSHLGPGVGPSCRRAGRGGGGGGAVSVSHSGAGHQKECHMGGRGALTRQGPRRAQEISASAGTGRGEWARLAAPTTAGSRNQRYPGLGRSSELHWAGIWEKPTGEGAWQ